MKNQVIKFRASGSEKERIEGMAKRSGTTVSEYCRQQSLTGSIASLPADLFTQSGHHPAGDDHCNNLNFKKKKRKKHIYGRQQ